MKIEVTLTGTEAIRDQFARLNRTAQFKAMAKTSQELYDYVELAADKHTKTGALFQSVFQKREGETFLIGNDLQRAPHAAFVHWGTRPHDIRPKRKKVLRWASGNYFVFAKVVKHPGYKGDPWLKRAAAMAPAIFERYVIATLKGK